MTSADEPLTSPREPMSRLAVISLAIALVAIPLTPIWGAGAVVAIAAIVTGNMALRRLRKWDSTERGKGVAIAALVIAYIVVVISVALLALVLLYAFGTGATG